MSLYRLERVGKPSKKTRYKFEGSMVGAVLGDVFGKIASYRTVRFFTKFDLPRLFGVFHSEGRPNMHNATSQTLMTFALSKSLLEKGNVDRIDFLKSECRK